MLELNIGLSTSDGGKVTVPEAITSLQSRGFTVVAQRVVYAKHAKGGEDTLIVRVIARGAGFLARVHLVAKDLRQECIAVADVRHNEVLGWLIGPKATEWGSFDLYYFHTFNEQAEAA